VAQIKIPQKQRHQNGKTLSTVDIMTCNKHNSSVTRVDQSKMVEVSLGL